MLKSALKAIINKPYQESFYHFHGKYKKLREKLLVLSFSNKMFLKIVFKPIPLGHSLTFPMW